ncbi:MAG TPA: hypothetical protein VFH92_07795 [Phenylobacterium sp.]|nr:hypothetical protein [Phenylobacterium sp.]
MPAAPPHISRDPPARRGRRAAWPAAAAFGLGVLIAGPGAAAPPADGVCKGAPEKGATLRGPVLHVPDGQTLCVARGFDPSRWIPLRLADAPASSTRAALMAVAFGKDVDCVVAADLSARCTIDGWSVGAAAGAPRAAEAARAWREAR